MLRPLFLAAVLTVAAAPATAQDAGRYQVTPGADGFVRLDTRTGATSHCSRQEGVWRCQPVIEEAGALADRLDALSAEVGGLAAALSEAIARVEALVARIDQLPPAEAEAPAAESRGFLATVMDRLLAVVRTLKHGDEA